MSRVDGSTAMGVVNKEVFAFVFKEVGFDLS